MSARGGLLVLGSVEGGVGLLWGQAASLFCNPRFYYLLFFCKSWNWNGIFLSFLSLTVQQDAAADLQ